MARILIVDDDPQELELLAQVARERGGHEVETATRGDEALERVERGGIDLLVTDYLMPGINGLELAKRAVSAQPSLSGRVLIVTGAMYGREDALAFAAGTEVLVKPFGLEEIASRIQNLLEEPKE